MLNSYPDSDFFQLVVLTLIDLVQTYLFTAKECNSTI